MDQRSKLFYRLWDSGDQNRVVAEYIGQLEQAVIECSSYVPHESIVGQRIRHLLPFANWHPPTLKQMLPESENAS